MAHGDFKDLPRRQASDNVLQNKALILLKIRNMIDIKGFLLQLFINLLTKSLLVLILQVVKSKTMSN